MRISTILGLLVTLSLLPSSEATDGFSVSMAFRTGSAPEAWSRLQFCGKLVRFDISNNAVVGHDTIHSGLGWYPSISFDGTRVAFFRSSARLEGGNLAGDIDTGYISVVNKDGTNLRDLVKLYAGQFGYSCDCGDCEGHFVDWPAGEWVYYERPPKTGEIWRINVNDPSLHHMVVKYDPKRGGWTNCACCAMETGNFWIRRFQLSADARYCGGMFKDFSGIQNCLHMFPPPEGLAPLTMAIRGNLPACNMTISPSGEYGSIYSAGCHWESSIMWWNHDVNQKMDPQVPGANTLPSLVDEVRSWVGRDVGDLGAYMRWAANSDKWLIVQAHWACGSNENRGGNQVLINWVENRAIAPSSNTNGSSRCQDAGDFWVDGGSGNIGKYEDVRGNWVSVTPRDVYPKSSVTGAGPYEVSLDAYPPDAEIRYTTDGIEPTQSSDLYNGPFTVTPEPARRTHLRYRAFRTGFEAAEGESRILVPSSNPLPAGYMKELLCLENEQGNMGVPAADTLAVWDKYVGENKAVPFEGGQVTANGHTYTWRFRTDSDGLWNPAPTQTAFSFWHTVIVSPQTRMVSIGARFQEMPHVWCNGRMVWDFYGWDGNREWTFGMNDCSFGLVKGANSVLMQMRPNPSSVFALRLTDGNGDDLTDLSYFPHSRVVKSGHVVTKYPVSGAALARDRLTVDASGPHSVVITDARGKTVASFRDNGSSIHDLGTCTNARGLYLVSVTAGGCCRAWLFSRL